MATSDDIFVNATVANSTMGQPTGLIYQQLKIITLILREVYGFRDEDSSLLTGTSPTPTFVTYPTL